MLELPISFLRKLLSFLKCIQQTGPTDWKHNCVLQNTNVCCQSKHICVLNQNTVVFCHMHDNCTVMQKIVSTIQKMNSSATPFVAAMLSSPLPLPLPRLPMSLRRHQHRIRCYCYRFLVDCCLHLHCLCFCHCCLLPPLHVCQPPYCCPNVCRQRCKLPVLDDDGRVKVEVQNITFTKIVFWTSPLSKISYAVITTAASSFTRKRLSQWPLLLMTSAASSGNDGGKQWWWKQRQRRGHTTINKKRQRHGGRNGIRGGGSGNGSSRGSGSGNGSNGGNGGNGGAWDLH